MQFEWDPKKAKLNLRKHGITSTKLPQCFWMTCH